ncbi:MAG: GrpB family protein [Chroococcidiopsidaceae cyanobacterium CP_BM_RX_35]|nr:GrpB family protein [Chroococcidiopsidaceae cyanobacterium CP_BM_RX_35]
MGFDQLVANLISLSFKILRKLCSSLLPNFRDYLIKHPHEAQKYACLKRELAEKFANDPEAYTNAKGEYIQTVTKLALRNKAPPNQRGSSDGSSIKKLVALTAVGFQLLWKQKKTDRTNAPFTVAEGGQTVVLC